MNHDLDIWVPTAVLIFLSVVAILKKKEIVKVNSKVIAWLVGILGISWVIWMFLMKEPMEGIRLLCFFLVSFASSNIYEILQLKGFAKSTPRILFIALSLSIFAETGTTLLPHMHLRSLYALVLALILYGSSIWLEHLKEINKNQ